MNALFSFARWLVIVPAHAVLTVSTLVSGSERVELPPVEAWDEL